MSPLAKLCPLLLLLPVFALAVPARETWDNECAKCHGAKGDGHVKQKHLGIKDYTDPKVQSQFSDAGLLKNLLLGISGDDGKVRMPSFKDKLTVPEARELVALIRSFAKSAGAPAVAHTSEHPAPGV